MLPWATVASPPAELPMANTGILRRVVIVIYLGSAQVTKAKPGGSHATTDQTLFLLV